MEATYQVKPIGVIHSPYAVPADAPRQGRLSNNEIGLEIFPEYADGLKYVETVSHIIVVYFGDRANRSVLQTKTPFGDIPIGVFACRSQNRPNPLAICVADLIRREGNVLIVRGVDALDASPLLDIKVYSPGIDSIPNATSGWHNLYNKG
jgi:tRNA-Thr(GGU) m(6)t(6)A37 methyltransferase TsaA